MSKRHIVLMHRGTNQPLEMFRSRDKKKAVAYREKSVREFAEQNPNPAEPQWYTLGTIHTIR